jgi:hypothetical protein
VTHGFDGRAPEHPHKPVAAGVVPYTQFDGSLSPSFSADGLTLAFSSTASNLVYGDGNTPSVERVGFDGSDAFAVSRLTFGFEPPAQEVSGAPAEPAITPDWRLYLTAHSLADGTVELDATAPAAGALRAVATGAVPLRLARAMRARRASRHSHRRRHRRRAAHRAVRAGVLAEAVAHSITGGLVTIVLRPAGAYEALATRPGGLSATVAVTFTSPGGQALHARIPVTFKRSGGRR